MRFLLECVGCCVRATSGDISTEEPSSLASSHTEETRSLVTAATEMAMRSSRRRKRTPSRATVADWRPSLFAISEDNAIQVGPEKAENRNRPTQGVVKPTASRNVKRCASSSSSIRANTHSRPRDFGHSPLPMVVPAFSAAPFMF